MAGEARQEWTWRDIFRSIGLAFSFSRLMVGFLGLAFMAVADGLISWTMSFDTWQQAEGSWAYWFGHDFLWWARWVVVGYIFLYTATGIAYSVKGELLDGEGAGAKESIGFVFRKFGPIFSTPLIFWTYIVLMAGFFGFVFWLLPMAIAKWAGWTLYYSIIWYTVGYFFVFLFSVLAGMGFIAFLFSFFLAPPIIATRQEGALDAVLDTIDLMRGKGAFWVSILVLLAAVLLGPVFLGKTFDVGYDVAEMTIEKVEFQKIVGSMPRQIQPRSGTLLYGAKVFWPGQWARPIQLLQATRYAPWVPITEAEAVGGTQHKVAGWILGIWVLILAGFSMSFTLGAFVAAGTLTYLIVREEEEFLEPSITEAPAKPEAKDEKNKKADEAAKDETKQEAKEASESRRKKESD